MGGIHETVGPPPGGRSVRSVNPAPSLATPTPALPFSLPASLDRSLQSAPGGFLHRSTLATMGAFPPPPASAGPDLEVDSFPTPVSPASRHPDPDEELSSPPWPRHAVMAHCHGRLPSSSSSSKSILSVEWRLPPLVSVGDVIRRGSSVGNSGCRRTGLPTKALRCCSALVGNPVLLQKCMTGLTVSVYGDDRRTDPPPWHFPTYDCLRMVAPAGG